VIPRRGDHERHEVQDDEHEGKQLNHGTNVHQSRFRASQPIVALRSTLLSSAIEEMLLRLPGLELAGDVRTLRSHFIDGVKSIPVRFTPQST
jgi:hypothetical protein